MVATIPKISEPELFVGFVAPIGTDLGECVAEFRKMFKRFEYDVVELKVTDVFKPLSRLFTPEKPLVPKPLSKCYNLTSPLAIFYAINLVTTRILTATVIGRIVKRRLRSNLSEQLRRFSKTVYLIHQLRRKEEIDLCRAVYGKLFFQISVYSRRGARVEFLARKFAESDNSTDINSFRSIAEQIVTKDENEADEDHGQRVSKIFHDADFILNIDLQNPTPAEQIEKFWHVYLEATKFRQIRWNTVCSSQRRPHCELWTYSASWSCYIFSIGRNHLHGF